MSKLRKRGALFIEYALILAFVISAGVVFLSSDSMVNSISGVFGKTSNLLAEATKGEKSIDEKNMDFTKALIAYISGPVGSEDSAIKPNYDKTIRNLSKATDSGGYALNSYFPQRWADYMGKDNYEALIGNISYAFYPDVGLLSDNPTWYVYIYNPENNDNKLLSERKNNEKISAEVYTYNVKSKEFTKKVQKSVR